MSTPTKRSASGSGGSNNQSPYKKMKNVTREWIPFTSMVNLAPNKCYKILGLVETHHERFGKGQQATIISGRDEKFRTQLPTKYLNELNPEDIVQIKRDVIEGKEVYVVFREKLLDGSFRIDLMEASAEWIEKFHANEEVPELEDSVEIRPEDIPDGGENPPKDGPSPSEDKTEPKNVNGGTGPGLSS